MTKVIANGVTINYETIGEGSPVLFIHGSGGSWKMWEPQIDVFSKEFKMFLIDMRGHGGSTKEFPDGKYSMKVIAEDVKHFLDAIGIQKIPIVGLSQGAVVASVFATKHPEYIEKLVLSNGYSEIPTKVSGWVLALSNAIFSLLPYNTIIKLMMKVYGNDQYTKRIIKDSLTIDKKMLLAMKKSEFPNHTGQLLQISAPTLIMAGDKKNVGPEVKAAQIMFENIPNAVVAIFKDAFDPLSTMRRDIFNDMVLDFLKENRLKDYEGVTYLKK